MKTPYLQRMLIWLGLAMTLATPWAAATNYYVVTSSQQPSPTPPWTNWGWAHTNLIEVVAAARDNDTVYVTNNTKYYLTNQIPVKYAVTVRSWGPGGILDPTNTILDGNYPTTTNRHFTLSNYWATLAGFTLSNGWGSANTNGLGNTGSSGGSISLYYGTVTNCIITRNYAISADPSYNQAGGGGIFMGMDSAKSGSVWNCTISRNIIGLKNCGGGILVNNGSWRIVNCTISGNTAPDVGYEGGGILMNSASGPGPGGVGVAVVSNCWVVSNRGDYGAGIKMSYNAECHNSFLMGNTSKYQGGAIRAAGNNVIRNCLIANNATTSSDGGGISASGGNPTIIQNCTIASNYCSGNGGGVNFANYDGFPKVENTIIWGNSAGGINSNWYMARTNPANAWATFTNCCTSPDIYSNSTAVFASGTNTITNDPRFVSIAIADFRLQSSSPCINAGVNRTWMDGALDLEGNRRIDQFNGQVDIGAYEYLPAGTLFVIH
ncbi:MAG: right-handed parallel beta-helix repeat-containing protein [Kiritimatiellaeota bacterium]|nr:right-handed parallel beta-helix repeat-containing protein [Kiritimatiellota bacterium]